MPCFCNDDPVLPPLSDSQSLRCQLIARKRKTIVSSCLEYYRHFIACSSEEGILKLKNLLAFYDRVHREGFRSCHFSGLL